MGHFIAGESWVSGELRFKHNLLAGGRYVGLQAPSSFGSGDITLILPSTLPAANGLFLAGETNGTLYFTNEIPAHQHPVADITGILGLDKGGTGSNLSTVPQFSMLYIFGSSTLPVSPNPSQTRKWLRMTGTGSSGATPAWDTLTTADMPSGLLNFLLPPQTGQQGKALVTDGTNVSWQTVAGGGGGSGTITSVGLSMPSAEFNVSPTSITTSGIFTVTWDTQPAYQVLGADPFGAVKFQAITSSHLPVVPIGKGGTGATDRNTALNALLPSQTGANGLVLKSDGSNASWQADLQGSGGSGAINNVCGIAQGAVGSHWDSAGASSLNWLIFNGQHFKISLPSAGVYVVVAVIDANATGNIQKHLGACFNRDNANLMDTYREIRYQYAVVHQLVLQAVFTVGGATDIKIQVENDQDAPGGTSQNMQVRGEFTSMTYVKISN